MRPSPDRSGSAPALFAASFAGQTALLVLAPLLADVGRSFDVSTATAGHTRAVAGLAGGVAALALARFAGRRRLTGLLQDGLVLLAAGSAATALAPAFELLLVAQIAIGAGIALVLSASMAAAAEWPQQGDRGRVMALTIAGPAVAWIVAMPLVGVLADTGWRTAMLVPIAAAGIALWLVSRYACSCEPAHTHPRGLVDDPGLLPWAAAELLAAAGWAGVSVYSGALLVEAYGATAATTAILLAATSLAYLPGTFVAKHWIDGAWRLPLVLHTLALAVLTVVAFAIRPGAVFSTVALATLVFLAGGRATAGAGYALDGSRRRRVGVTSVRAAAAQFGYLLGALAGGAGLAVWGYTGAGIVLSLLFALAAGIHVAVMAAERVPALDRTLTRASRHAGAA